MRQLITPMSVAILLSACVSSEHKTIAGLDDVNIEVENVRIEGGIEKAMQSYQQFLEKTPDSEATPEAIRRLADLNIEREYGMVSDEQGELVKEVDESVANTTQVTDKSASKPVTQEDKASLSEKSKAPVIADLGNESSSDFEKRASKNIVVSTKQDKTAALPDGTKLEDLQTEGAKKAIALYLKLLKKFPLYERNDQVLYQLSRAYEETGEVEKAMGVMNRLVKEYPYSRHFPEVQFRRGEYFFTRKKLIDAEESYQSLLKRGKGTGFYEFALYKLGWSLYKQELYEEGLVQFFALLDFKLEIGYDFEQTHNKTEQKRIEDTYRVISLSFSNLGGAEAVIEFFKKHGARSYESRVYSHLAEFYLKKRRYSDAAKTYNAYIENNPFNEVSPHFSMRVIEIYQQGGFPRLVIESKKKFSSTYGLKADYWKYFEPSKHPKVIGYLKKNITDLANFYHSLYQDRRFARKKKENFTEAVHWYREFLGSFPQDQTSAGINYQLADLYLENSNMLLAAKEYENTAYNYQLNEKSSKAGYAAVSTYRQYLKRASGFEKNRVMREVIRVSLKFVDVFPAHKEAAIVLSAAAEDLYELKDFQFAINASQRLIKDYPSADIYLQRSSWLIIAYASFDLLKYADAESAFLKVLAIKPKKPNPKQINELRENLAAAIYKQGEQAIKLEEYQQAADHFLRVGRLVPSSKIRSTAEFDAATALVQLKSWQQAADVLNRFRETFPGHKLQPEVTKKLAFVYKEDNKLDKAAAEFERIYTETKDFAVKRESLLIAAEMYGKIEDQQNELRVYKQFVRDFPKPVEEALEIYTKIAEIYHKQDDEKSRIKTLKYIVKVESKAGKARNDRTKYLAGTAALELAKPLYDDFVKLKLTMPFKKNLKKKQKQMKYNVGQYNRLVDYGVANVTAAATYYIAETYYAFSQALLKSERPKNLTELELEQYTEILEEQAYPFEEKGIKIHKKNIELLSVGIFSQWIDKSLSRLAVLVPGRYAKAEDSTGVLDSMLSYRYEVIKPKTPEIKPPVSPENVTPVESVKEAAQSTNEPENMDNSASLNKTDTEQDKQASASESDTMNQSEQVSTQ